MIPHALYISEKLSFTIFDLSFPIFELSFPIFELNFPNFLLLITQFCIFFTELLALEELSFQAKTGFFKKIVSWVLDFPELGFWQMYKKQACLVLHEIPKIVYLSCEY